jgi:predicted nucleic acid-binding Zn ribbon protein
MPYSPLPSESHRAEPVPLSEGLDRVLAGLGAPPVDALTTIRDRWSELVGPQAAEALVPVAVDHGRVVATATSGVWASQAKWLEPALVERAAELLGPGVVEGLVVRTERSSRRP